MALPLVEPFSKAPKRTSAPLTMTRLLGWSLVRSNFTAVAGFSDREIGSWPAGNSLSRKLGFWLGSLKVALPMVSDGTWQVAQPILAKVEDPRLMAAASGEATRSAVGRRFSLVSSWRVVGRGWPAMYSASAV